MAFTIGDLVEHSVDRVPDRVALIQGDRSFIYAEVEQRANKLAHHLQSVGVGPGDKVALYSRNTVEAVEAMVAIFKIRAVMVNVNFRYVAAELQYLLENSDAVAVIHERRYSETVAEALPRTPQVRHCLVVEDGTDGPDPAVPDGVTIAHYDDALAAQSPERDFAERSNDDIYMLYTGGTTGSPKGVMWRQEDVFMVLGGGIDFLTGERIADEWALADQAVDAGPLVSAALPPLIHGGAQWAILMALFNGRTSVLVPEFDPAYVWQALTEHRINLMFITGDAMARPLIEAWDPQKYDSSSLLYLSSSAALFSPAVKDQFIEAFPHAMISDSVGASETGFSGIALAEKGKTHTGGPRVRIDGQTTVLDDDGNKLGPGSGIVGKLARTGHIPIGYYKDEAKTAATFRTYGGTRYSIPGDDARVEDDGTVTMLGRGSVSINTGGEKVHPEEVEAALKTHPEVYDALVIGLPDERMGQRVAAVLRTRDGRCPPLDQLNAVVRKEIAGYKCPRSLWVVDEVRRTPAGKPDYRWAVEIAASRAADASQVISK
ncbi:acyl-CoA synthetase [Dietzia sp. ANT_WB102]|uniref:acyl-CoA synthetase n=1 Tax=Dietzia sp. ANT_WB102 TaxID=2597345 RepID=UPI0011EF2AB4|nr:acyl-CoA synthetase [Dietzia sp. ANT_WB102]KAA0916542.1 acyl-CoA synthetase [Dietzia sp. ANT_WB102]